jgi:hypothetical protein
VRRSARQFEGVNDRIQGAVKGSRTCCTLSFITRIYVELYLRDPPKTLGSVRFFGFGCAHHGTFCYPAACMVAKSHLQTCINQQLGHRRRPINIKFDPLTVLLSNVNRISRHRKRRGARYTGHGLTLARRHLGGLHLRDGRRSSRHLGGMSL